MANWSDYESLKRKWITDNPNATPKQYSAAMMAIASKLGL